ncbi:MAG: hypothetical protein HY296_02455 [Thaumarchaeota archaeon]|nr:hypothetical protein [Nitrososphaerota archaeon]
MRKTPADQKLTCEIQRLLPARLKVSSLQSRIRGNLSTGTVRIYCSSDKRSFLSDFEASMDENGAVSDLWLDGQSVKTKRLCDA